MKSRRFFDRRSAYSLASIGLLLGMVAPSLVPAFASAGTITTRSITMSSAATGAAATYEVKGTTSSTGAIAANGGMVIQFCSDSPLLNTDCTAPTGMTVAASPTAGGTDAGSAAKVSNSVVKWTSTSGVSASTAFDFTISGINNPTAVDTFYARVTTYANSTDLGTYTDNDTLGTVADEGSVALSTTDTVGVTAYVLESMTFCVSGGTVDLTGNCGVADPDGAGAGTPSGTSSPSMTLGETTGTVTALQAGAVSTGDVYTQLSSNAASGVTVSMKSNATSCGGLFRNGNTANCEIGPQTNNAVSIAAGDAKFGVKVSNPSDALGATAASGGGTISRNGDYSAANFFMEYAAGNATGVTSTYGSPVFASTGPVDNQDVKLTFGASINNQTPAGVYGANLSLIATGKF